MCAWICRFVHVTKQHLWSVYSSVSEYLRGSAPFCLIDVDPWSLWRSVLPLLLHPDGKTCFFLGVLNIFRSFTLVDIRMRENKGVWGGHSADKPPPPVIRKNWCYLKAKGICFCCPQESDHIKVKLFLHTGWKGGAILFVCWTSSRNAGVPEVRLCEWTLSNISGEVHIQPDKTSDLQRRMAEDPQTQVCKVCHIIPKKSYGM